MAKYVELVWRSEDRTREIPAGTCDPGDTFYPDLMRKHEARVWRELRTDCLDADQRADVDAGHLVVRRDWGKP
jgi:hypothetical protein